jgi:hypothetical protein
VKPPFTPAVLLALAVPPAAFGQDKPAPTLQVQGGLPAGARSSVTEAPGVLRFTVINFTAEDRDARVAVFYAARPDVQYARDVWVPARSAAAVWVPVGPAPPGPPEGISRELKVLLYDRAGGAGRQIVPPGDDGRVRGRAVVYRRREPSTSVLVDTDEDGSPQTGPAARLARAARPAAGLPTGVSVVRDLPLPPTADALGGVDVFVLAGNRLGSDPPGRAVVRRWVEAGGTLWVMLDRVDPETVAAVLGDDADLAVAGRTSLTTFEVVRPGDPTAAEERTVEQPVPFVRVFPSAADQVIHQVDGWPASFVRRVGRGKVVFTALGPDGWHRPRTRQDAASPDPDTPDLPVPLRPLDELAGELHPPPEPDPFPPEVFRPMLADEVGYRVVGPGTAAALFGGSLAVAAGLGLAARRSARPELAGWVGPGAAVLAAGLFVGLGERSRQAVPPTAAAAGLVDVVPGSGGAVGSGLYAVYHPESGAVDVGTRTGAELGLDAEGLDGQPRRRVQYDTDIWAWEGLGLPAGLRMAPYRSAGMAGRVAAVARFGPDGVDGRFEPGAFAGPADAVIATPAREPVPVRLGPDGAFTVGPDDALPAGQYLADAVLSGRQQRRQEVYRQLLTGPMPRHLRNRDLLLAWTTPPDLPVRPDPGARVVGAALLAVPLEFDRPPAGTKVLIPRAFVRARRENARGRLEPVLPTAGQPVEQRLRFEVPPSVRPLAVGRATFTLRVKAAGRRVAVSGAADGKPVPLFDGTNPAEVRLDITDPRLLAPDADGALYLTLSVGPAEGTTEAWKIEALGLELAGEAGQPR